MPDDTSINTTESSDVSTNNTATANLAERVKELANEIADLIKKFESDCAVLKVYEIDVARSLRTQDLESISIRTGLAGTWYGFVDGSS